MDNEALLEILNRNIDFIKQADSKATYASTVLFIVVGYLISKSPLYTDKTYSLICFVLLLLYAVCVTFIIFKTIFPSIHNSLSKDSNIYFGSIASKSFKQFKKRAVNMNDSDYHLELIEQVYITSEIVKVKMMNVKKSILWLLPFVILAGTASLVAKYF